MLPSSPQYDSAHAPLFFRCLNNPEFIQFMSESLIGIHMIVFFIAARPIKFESSQGLR
jgi:hypothetical protein